MMLSFVLSEIAMILRSTERTGAVMVMRWEQQISTKIDRIVESVQEHFLLVGLM